MRNAFAIYSFHLPKRDRSRFLALLFPNVDERRRIATLRHPRGLRAFDDPNVQRALRVLRPATYRTTDVILNAADVAIRIHPDRRDAFILHVLGIVAAVVDIFRMRTLYDWMEPLLRNISNEDPRVVRALGRLGVDPYHVPFLNDPQQDGACREYSVRLNAEERAVARLIGPPFAGITGYDLEVVREMATTRRSRSRAEAVVADRTRAKKPKGAIEAAQDVARTRLEHEAAVLRGHVATLRRQLDAQHEVMKALEVRHETDQARIQELESAEERTRRAFENLRQAEERRFDAYFGGRRPYQRSA